MFQKFQFFHSREYDLNGVMPKGGATFCVEVPNTATLVDMLNLHFNIGRTARLEMNFGSCRCHPLDRYSKKEGNKISSERMSPQQFFVVTALVLEDTLLLDLSNGKNLVTLKGYLKEPTSNSRLEKVTDVTNY